MKARELRDRLQRALGARFDGPALRAGGLHVEFMDDVPLSGPYLAVHYKGLSTFVALADVDTVCHDRFSVQLSDAYGDCLLFLDKGRCLGAI